MYKLNKYFERLSRLFKSLISKNYKLNHKYQNKNQVTNADTILDLLKIRNFAPNIIVDVGCGYGQWTQKLLRVYPSSKYFLFDADKNNISKLNDLKSKFKNLFFKICLLSNEKKVYDFYNMGYGSSIFEEQTSHIRNVEKIESTTLNEQLPSEIRNHKNNLIKLDIQGAEIKVLDGLKDLINFFEVLILEVSLHNYNKNAPLMNDVLSFMNKNNFKLYDIFDLKRLGEDRSFLLQFDCVFVRNNSELFKVKF